MDQIQETGSLLDPMAVQPPSEETAAILRKQCWD